MEWLQDNWIVLVLGFAYMAERGQWFSSHVRAILTAIASSIEEHKKSLGTAKSISFAVDSKVRTPLAKDALDSVLDNVQPKPVARVPVGRKILGMAIKALPVVSRFL